MRKRDLEKKLALYEQIFAEQLERERELKRKLHNNTVVVNDRKFILSNKSNFIIKGDVTATWIEQDGSNISRLTYHSQRREEKC